jgi:hypothetical protein
MPLSDYAPSPAACALRKVKCNHGLAPPERATTTLTTLRTPASAVKQVTP